MDHVGGQYEIIACRIDALLSRILLNVKDTEFNGAFVSKGFSGLGNKCRTVISKSIVDALCGQGFQDTASQGSSACTHL